MSGFRLWRNNMKKADVGPQLDFVPQQTRSGLRSPSTVLAILVVGGLAFWGYHLLTQKKSDTVMAEQRISTPPINNSKNAVESIVAATDVTASATAAATAEIKKPDQSEARGKHLGDSAGGVVIDEKSTTQVVNVDEAKDNKDKNAIAINSLPKHSLSSTRASLAAIKSSSKKLVSKPKNVAASSIKKSVHRTKIASAASHKKKTVSHADVALAAAYGRTPSNYAKTIPIRQIDSEEWQSHSGQQAEAGSQIVIPDVILKNKRNVRLTIEAFE